jgi:hypothetical protein
LEDDERERASTWRLLLPIRLAEQVPSRSFWRLSFLLTPEGRGQRWFRPFNKLN